MRWGITGTPGTGKTTVADHLSSDRDVVHLSDILTDSAYHAGSDPTRDTIIADIDALATWVDEQPDDIIIESHLAHLLPVDRVIVLRCHPDTLRQRLSERSEISPEKVAENVDAERLDLILSAAVEHHGMESVFELDTTDLAPNAVADAVENIIAGKHQPRPGNVSFLCDP